MWRHVESSRGLPRSSFQDDEQVRWQIGMQLAGLHNEWPSLLKGPVSHIGALAMSRLTERRNDAGGTSIALEPKPGNWPPINFGNTSERSGE